jgi:hypothetical protein
MKPPAPPLPPLSLDAPPSGGIMGDASPPSPEELPAAPPDALPPLPVPPGAIMGGGIGGTIGAVAAPAEPAEPPLPLPSPPSSEPPHATAPRMRLPTTTLALVRISGALLGAGVSGRPLCSLRGDNVLILPHPLVVDQQERHEADGITLALSPVTPRKAENLCRSVPSYGLGMIDVSGLRE